MEYLESKDAFENAVKKGLKNPEDYMYMYTLNQKDYFKNRDNRNYISIKRDNIEGEDK